MQQCKNRDARPLEWKDGEGSRAEKWEDAYRTWTDTHDPSVRKRMRQDMAFVKTFEKGWDMRQPEIDALKAEIAHWKSNHANMVSRSRVLMDRPDLPLERAKAFEQLGTLKAENESLNSETEEFRADALRFKAENENLRKDAERYRWLRGQNIEPFVEDGDTVFSVCAETEFDRERKWVGRDLDSVIDAAMNASFDAKGE